ncbi:MAG: hypothetical protein EBR15_02915 [Gammaproteobacteria bacterium]|jgi:hypothetical protein|nr:hypothetical protein [Gammaproteobacteria bacterium]NBX40377.1 hypothetical protein [Gammaproteobacteria bacterium]
MHQSFLQYRGKRYLWWALSLCFVAVLAYAWHQPVSPPNGGTWLGYTLGTIGALLILWLTALGVRKRSYQSAVGTVQGWVSAHVYLGLALIVVATLHTGFQFGWNVHTLAYVLMMTVIVSGLFGVVMYLRFPERLSANRSSQTREQMLQEIADLDQRALRIAANLPAEFAEAIASNRDRTRIGGTVLDILRGRDRSQVSLAGDDGVLQVVPNPAQEHMLEWLGRQLSRSTDAERTRRIDELVNLMASRRSLLRRVIEDARIAGWLQVWLYVHVPITFALLGSLIAHVVSVFLYW